MSSYASSSGHGSMVFDDVRNAAYGAALGQAVCAESIVLDLGSGLGIHGLIAAAKGARRVYLVDPSPVTAIARRVAAENGLADRVTCVQQTIEQAHLPEKVDVIVSALTGNFLLEEDLLPALFHARDRYLKPSGVLIPDCGEMRVVPVSAEAYYRKQVSGWSACSQGLGFAPVRRYAANSLHYDGAEAMKAAFMAAPATIATLDFNSATRAECSNQVTFAIEKDGDCHGFLGWFRMRLGQDWLSTSPQRPATHWSQAFLPVDPPLQVKCGQRLSLRLVRPQFGDWTWICDHEGKRQQHSTFFSRSVTPEQWHCHSKTYSVELNEKGELAKFVIDLMTGANTTRTIFERAAERFAGRFSTAEELEQRVQSVISSYGK